MPNRDLTPWRNIGTPGFARDPFASFRREMDRLFDDFFAPAEARSFGGSAQQAGGRGVWPSLDVDETEQAYTITAELPGVDPQDVQLELRDNALVLRGEKRSERNEEDGGRRYAERSYGRFERVVPLPSEVDSEQIEASYDNGLLRVVLPKTAQVRDRTRRIEIRGAAGAGQAGGGQAQASGAQTAGATESERGSTPPGA